MKNRSTCFFSLLLLIIVVSIFYFFTRNNSDSFSEIIINQKQIDIIIQKEINNKKNTVEKPMIMINPYKISPLSALIIFNTEDEESFDLFINEISYGKTEKNTKHAIPIYGLIPEYENKIILKVKDKEYIHIIEPKSVDYQNMHVITQSNIKDDSFYFLIGGENPNTVAYDNNGNIRWLLDLNLATDIAFLENGHLLIGNGDGNVFEGFSGLYEIDFLGKIYKEYYLGSGTHHSIDVLPNGNYLIATGNNDNLSWDYIIELDSKTGKTVKKIDIFNIFRKIDPLFYEDNNNTLYNNSNYYDKKTNSLTISLRTLNSVININYDTLELNWIYGDKQNWKNFENYLLKGKSNIDTYGQHSVFYENNILGLFDNHTLDIYSIDCEKIDNIYSSAILFEINGNQYKSVLKFSNNKKYLSPYLSSFNKLENNNYLVNYGYVIDKEEFKRVNCNFDYYVKEPETVIFEIDENGNVLFEGSIDEMSKQFAYKNNFYNYGIKNFSVERYIYYENEEVL